MLRYALLHQFSKSVKSSYDGRLFLRKNRLVSRLFTRLPACPLRPERSDGGRAFFNQSNQGIPDLGSPIFFIDTVDTTASIQQAASNLVGQDIPVE